MKMLYHSLNLDFDAADPRARDAAIISEKMDLLNRIVEQILDFARSTEPRFAPVNINELIEKLALLTRHKLQNQNIELYRELDPELLKAGRHHGVVDGLRVRLFKVEVLAPLRSIADLTPDGFFNNLDGGDDSASVFGFADCGDQAFAHLN